MNIFLKNIFIFIIFLMPFNSLYANYLNITDKFDYGISLGSGLTGWDNSYYNKDMIDPGFFEDLGFKGGVFGNYKCLSFLKINISLNYMFFKFRGSVGKSNYFLRSSNHLIQIPLLFKFNLFKGLYLNIGPELSFIMRYHLEDSKFLTTGFEKIKKNKEIYPISGDGYLLRNFIGLSGGWEYYFESIGLGIAINNGILFNGIFSVAFMHSIHGIKNYDQNRDYKNPNLIYCFFVTLNYDLTNCFNHKKF